MKVIGKRKIIGIIMLCIALIFIGFALQHPEMSFPFSNEVAYCIYGLYIFIMLICIILPSKKK